MANLRELEMWCSNCGQDVPGIASKQAEGQTVCARCGTQVGNKTCGETGNNHVESCADMLAGDIPPMELDDWELDEDLRTADRLINEVDGEPGAVEPQGMEHTIEAYHKAVRGWHTQLSDRPTVSGASASPKFVKHRPRVRISLLAWSAISLGLMVLVCGSVLLTWGYLFGRGELWSLGLPIALGGQAVLLLGIFLHMESLWQNSRKTSKSLVELDESVTDLRHATSMMSTTHSGPAQSFYAHMAEGASPELLLADLKGQMDLLTMRVARKR
jgi:hypothetical protein